MPGISRISFLVVVVAAGALGAAAVVAPFVEAHGSPWAAAECVADPTDRETQTR